MKFKVPVIYSLSYYKEVEADSEGEAIAKAEAMIENSDPQICPNVIEPSVAVPDSLSVDYMSLSNFEVSDECSVLKI